MQTRSAITLLLATIFGLVVATAQAADSPLKVFILAGQSNMQGHAHIRTMDVMRLDPVTAPLLTDLLQTDGSPVICDEVWISSLGSSEEEKTGKLTVGFGADARGPKIGPEFAFGVYMHQQLQEPILIIKTAWGGKSLNTDFRPPSAGPYQFNKAQLEQFQKQGKSLDEMQREKDEATGVYYRLMIDHIQRVLADIQRVAPDYDPQDGYELAGFVWFQGWNDMVDRSTYPDRDQPGGYDAYSEVMADFIRDVRKDLSAPKLPFVIGVLGVGGPVEAYTPAEQRYKQIHQNFRRAMAAPAELAEFQGNVAAVWTDQYWDMDLKRIRIEDGELQAAVKKQTESEGLSPDQSRELLEQKRDETFTAEERDLLENGASNAEFHYLGSCKIMTQIGKGFAQAMGELLTEQKKAGQP